MRQLIVEKYNGRLTRPTNNVARIIIPTDGTIARLDVYTPNISGSGNFYFQFRINGVAQFADIDRLILDTTSKHATKTGLAIDVTDGDVLTFDFERLDSGTVFEYSEYSIDLDDNVIPLGDVVGPASATDDHVATFDGITGKLIQDSGKVFSTDGTLASNSPDKVPVESAVKAYADSVGTAVAAMIPAELADLSDVDTAGESDGDVLTFDVGSGKYLPAPPSAGSVALDDLTDVTITTPTNDDILQRKGGVFVNRSPTQVAADLAELIPVANLSDVTLTSPTNDDILQRKGGVFVNRSPTQVAADLAELIPIVNLSDVTFTSPTNDDFLQRKGGLWVNRTPAQVATDLGVTDAFIFKGVIDCSANPNYPAADAGNVYKISVAGKIGGASGPNVEVGDSITCIADATASGNQATVGSYWYISQVNIDGAVIGPASATNNAIATFSGTGGKLIQDSTKLLPSGSIVGTSDSQTLTNKILDFEGTGNVITTVEKIWIPAAGTNGATPAPVWDLPASGSPTATDVAGTNIHKGVLSFADSGLQTAQMTLLLPGDWSGAIDAKIIWYTTATSGNCKWFLSTAFTDTGATATDDPAFNTAQSVTTAAPGTGSRITNSAIASLTLTGSAAGSLFHLKIGRDGTDGSDTIGAAALLVGVEITWRRAI